MKLVVEGREREREREGNKEEGETRMSTYYPAYHADRVRPNTRGRNIERFPFRLYKFTWSSVHFLFDLFSTSVFRSRRVTFIREYSLLVLGDNTTFLSTTCLVASFHIVLQPRPFSVCIYTYVRINIFLNRLSSGNYSD